ncbi:MAG: hypothetical protein LUQ50_10125 [Methanospirillum sp.]|uniref:hypothetical protein n=1 Tax=Methanospirillum sp. TaxID=45200 RepID=UPI0023711689|nr:hypothetical protein [Methanospirillum sp.]MDD1729414.1 hypothetical protein [Methanospirillum sp.]
MILKSVSSGKIPDLGILILIILALFIIGIVSAVPCSPQGPIEPTGIKEAGTFYQAGSYILHYARSSPKPLGPEESRPSNWDWQQYGPFQMSPGSSYHIVFSSGGASVSQSSIVPENLPSGSAYTSFTNNDRERAYAYCISKSPSGPSGSSSSVSPCRDYWGPIEPNQVLEPGSHYPTGSYLITYAQVDRYFTTSESGQPANWNWQQYGPVQFDAGYCYNLEFQESGAITIRKDTRIPDDLPANEAYTTYSNYDKKHRYVFCIPTGSGGSTSTSDSSSTECNEKFDNGNLGAVENKVTCRPQVTFSSSVYICKITNYHWNYGKGTSQTGEIMLRNVNDGMTYGPWKTTGGPGQCGVPNAYWVAHVDEVVRAGTYLVEDTDEKTWSTNAKSNYCGQTQILYRLYSG